MEIRKFLILSVVTLYMFSCKTNQKSDDDQAERVSNLVLNPISLAEWSFHKALFDKKMDHLGFIKKAGEMGFTGVEYVNQFFKDKAHDTTYLRQMTETAILAGVDQLLIMVDGEGYLADTDKLKRDSAVTNHFKWVDAAAYLGCHSIRVNAHGEGSAEEVAVAAVDGLSRLADYAATKKINVIVENHGGYSSDGKWLAAVATKINKPNFGTLPDFGNFCLKRKDGAMWGTPCLEEYDRYLGVQELLPFAKALSAKSYEFGELGFETTIDYMKMMGLVKASGYQGFIGVEYEGDGLGEEEGIKATKALIEKCMTALMK